MRKIFIILALLLCVTSVVAISFFGDTSFKGYAITNVSRIDFSDGTNMTTAGGGVAFDGNMSGMNLTDVDCIIYLSGGMDCSG